MTPRTRAAVYLCALIGLPLPAAAQNILATPTYGTVALTAGFTPDPHVRSISAGGDDAVTVAGCTAYIHSAAPDLDLDYVAGDYPLTIRAESDEDVTLLVNTPDGGWHCNDDTNGTDPSISFESPQSGNYNIWVGTYGAPSGSLPEARLFVTEVTEPGDFSGVTGSAVLNWMADPTYGTENLSAGFTPDPHVRSIRAGGGDEVDLDGPGCMGYVNGAAPDLDLNYTAGTSDLRIYAKSKEDITLIVNQPDGSWICSDDANGTNPAIVLTDPQSGNYNIWIGTYRVSPDPLPESVLYISELAPRW